MADNDRTITMLHGAWDCDEKVDLRVPPSWILREFRLATAPALSEEDIYHALAHPVTGPPLATLAHAKSRVAVLVDDLTRPTCAAAILGPLLAQLEAAGVAREDLALFLATGSHGAPSAEDILRKAGGLTGRFGRVVVHDCHGPCLDMGRTARGTPVFVNADLMTYDVKVGIGAVFPHPAAAFSGGAKILAPGMCGAATIRHLHDHVRSAKERGGPLACDLRDEIGAIARMAGFVHSIVAIPGADRNAVACYAGPPEETLARAVDRFRALAACRFPQRDEVDMLILDAYPFDSTLQFAHDRALWPCTMFPVEIPVVLLAQCQRGAGTHEYFPAADPFSRRVWRRLRSLHGSDFRRIPEIVGNARALAKERKREVLVVAEGVDVSHLRQVFPHGSLCASWDIACGMLSDRLRLPQPRVAFFHTAPLLLPIIPLEPIT